MNAAAIGWEPGPWLGSNQRQVKQETAKNRSSSFVESATLIGVVADKPEYKKMADERLMFSISLGDRRALEELYDRYVNGCYGLALKIVREPGIAEEIVQDVFLKLWVKPQSYVPERGKFSGWLLTLVHNRSVDRLRRANAGGQKNNVPLDMDNGNGLTVADMLPDQAATPYEVAWRSEKGTIVREALKKLPTPQRDAISLAYFGGLTQKEIAERLGEPLGTIKTRTRSGLMALRRILGKQGALGELE